jgi:hypothetical protein
MHSRDLKSAVSIVLCTSAHSLCFSIRRGIVADLELALYYTVVRLSFAIFQGSMCWDLKVRRNVVATAPRTVFLPTGFLLHVAILYIHGPCYQP